MAIDLHLKHPGKDFWCHRFFDRAVRSYETSLIKHDGSIRKLCRDVQIVNNDPNTKPGPGEFLHRPHRLYCVTRIHR